VARLKIAIAPNAFRGSLTAQQAAACIAAGLRRSALHDADVVLMPLADGGDGTLITLLDGLGGEEIAVPTVDPLGRPIAATFGRLHDGATAVVELARASGNELLTRAERNPLIATTRGTGDLIRAAVERGCRRILVGMGGSATVDGGAGCLQALGVRLLDGRGEPISPGGGGLAELARIDPEPALTLLRGAEIVLLSDVTNLLTGKQGAARVFGPQKGATPPMVEQLDAALAHFAAIIKRDVGADVTTLPGAGAAGGFGAGMVGCLGAALLPGGATIIAQLGYDRLIPTMDVIITGEGRLDGQTMGGKAVQSVAELAAQSNIPVIALAGTLDADSAALRRIGVRAAWSIMPRPCTLGEALANAAEWLTAAAEQLGNTLAAVRDRRSTH
jgi:glycerate kinase